MEGLIIYNLFFLAPVLNVIGAFIKYITPIHNKFIPNVVLVFGWIICGVFGWCQGESLIVIIGQYMLLNGTLVASVATHGWDSAYGVKTIISDVMAREKQIFF